MCTMYHTLAVPYQYPICTSSITCIILYLYPVSYPVCAMPVAYVYPTIPYRYLSVTYTILYICTLHLTLSVPHPWPILYSISVPCTIPYLYLTHDLYYTVYLYPVPYPICALPMTYTILYICTLYLTLSVPCPWLILYSISVPCTILYLYLTHDLYYIIYTCTLYRTCLCPTHSLSVPCTVPVCALPIDYLYPVPHPVCTLPEDSLIPNDSTTVMPILARYSSTSDEMGAAPDSSVWQRSRPSCFNTFLKIRALANVYPHGFPRLEKSENIHIRSCKHFEGQEYFEGLLIRLRLLWTSSDRTSAIGI